MIQMTGNHPQWNICAGRQSDILRCLSQPQHVISKSHQHSRTKSMHQFNLLTTACFCPRTGRQQQRIGMVKNRFANIVAAVDHAKTINGVHHIVRFQTL